MYYTVYVTLLSTQPDAPKLCKSEPPSEDKGLTYYFFSEAPPQPPAPPQTALKAIQEGLRGPNILSVSDICQSSSVSSLLFDLTGDSEQVVPRLVLVSDWPSNTESRPTSASSAHFCFTLSTVRQLSFEDGVCSTFCLYLRPC